MDPTHISIEHDTNGNAVVEVADTELYDFVEDYLSEECDMEPCRGTHSDNGIPCVHRMTFPETVTIHALREALLKLDPDEIERIYEKDLVSRGYRIFGKPFNKKAASGELRSACGCALTGKTGAIRH